MNPRFHLLVQRDISQALRYYDNISHQLGNRFWQAFEDTCARIATHPRHFHFAPCGRRRANFSRFPWHLLFIEEGMAFILSLHVTIAGIHGLG